MRDFLLLAASKRFEAKLDCRRKNNTPHRKFDLSISKHCQTKDGAVEEAKLTFLTKDVCPQHSGTDARAITEDTTDTSCGPITALGIGPFVDRCDLLSTSANLEEGVKLNALTDLPITAWHFPLTMSDLQSQAQSSSLPLHGVTGVSSCQAR
jgi:hypothetical protein